MFHSSLLEPYQDSTILGRIKQPPTPIELEDGPKYDILYSKIVSNKLYYLVNLLGYSPSERTWEPIENVTNAHALLEDFHRQYPDKSGPQSKTSSISRQNRVLNPKRLVTLAVLKGGS